MRNVPFVLAVLLTLPTAAQGALLRVDITYTDGHVVSGPLTADLDVLPESVIASFTLGGTAAGSYDLADVVESSLVFGDGAWSAGNLESLSTTIMPADAGVLAVASLTYAYGPIDTPTTDGRLAANFPLDIQGTDVASGQPFHYQYDTSSQTVTVVPEPSSMALAALGLAVLAVVAWRRHLRLGLPRADRRLILARLSILSTPTFFEVTRSASGDANLGDESS
jgi:hypothetical protein